MIANRKNLIFLCDEKFSDNFSGNYFEKFVGKI